MEEPTLVESLLAEALRRFSAGGWVAWALLAASGFAFWVVLRQRRMLAGLRRRLHGSSVRGGHLAESLAPLVDGFPVDVEKEGTSTVFLGQPVDYVHFDPDRGVVFIEVKSGGAGLSEKQRRLRDQVEAGAVTWTTFRVDDG